MALSLKTPKMVLVRRLEHSETQLTSDVHLKLTSSSRERELAIAIGLDVGAAYHAAYVNNMRLGFLLRLAVAIHHYLPRVILHF
jgi:hypothetical protein